MNKKKKCQPIHIRGHLIIYAVSTKSLDMKFVSLYKKIWTLNFKKFYSTFHLDQENLVYSLKSSYNFHYSNISGLKKLRSCLLRKSCRVNKDQSIVFHKGPRPKLTYEQKLYIFFMYTNMCFWQNKALKPMILKENKYFRKFESFQLEYFGA